MYLYFNIISSLDIVIIFFLIKNLYLNYQLCFHILLNILLFLIWWWKKVFNINFTHILYVNFKLSFVLLFIYDDSFLL